MMQITKKSKEWNSLIYNNFIDLEKAFDSYGNIEIILVPSDVVNKCVQKITIAFRHNNQQSGWFKVKSGVDTVEWFCSFSSYWKMQ